MDLLIRYDVEIQTSSGLSNAEHVFPNSTNSGITITIDQNSLNVSVVDLCDFALPLDRDPNNRIMFMKGELSRRGDYIVMKCSNFWTDYPIMRKIPKSVDASFMFIPNSETNQTFQSQDGGETRFDMVIDMNSFSDFSGEYYIRGMKGDTGDKGDTGVRGSDGVKGDTGPRGYTGAVGPQGLTGVQGPRGQSSNAHITIIICSIIVLLVSIAIRYK